MPPTTAEPLTQRILDHAEELRRFLTPAPGTMTGFDNRPTWDNRTGGFDNRPTWDNWNRR